MHISAATRIQTRRTLNNAAKLLFLVHDDCLVHVRVVLVLHYFIHVVFGDASPADRRCVSVAYILDSKILCRRSRLSREPFEMCIVVVVVVVGPLP